MGNSRFGKSDKGSKKEKNTDKVFRRIGTMWESKKYEGTHNISVDDYHGDLIFQDKETKKFYKVKAISLYNPNEKAPENAIYNLTIDLKNDYQTEVVGEDTSDEDDTDSPDERDPTESEDP